MKGNVVDIYKAFDGSDKKLVIPVYQRNYDWTVKQCEQLFDDIVDMIEQGRPKHFFGAVVGDPEDSFTWVVIDGQQRMTTVSLLMLALVHAIEAGEINEADSVGNEKKDGKPQSSDSQVVRERKPSRLANRLLNNYLTVAEGDEQKFKLKPVKDDANAYVKLFGPEERFIEESKITANYRYFRNRLRETELSAQVLWDKGICQLEVMLLDLEPHDDPQRIFESLNSTGLALKESDKIRNLVLMGLPHREQVRLYEHFWNPMEINVDFRTDHFIRWYLVAQTSRTPKQDDVFDFFKRFVATGTRSASDVVEDMYAFSEMEQELSNAQTGYRKIDRRLRQANLVLGDVVKPLLWLCYRDMKSGVISPEDFTQVVTIVESYVFRRVVSSVAANALNKIFASAYSELRKMRKNNEPYSEILAYMVTERGQSGRFPDDREFSEAFRTRDFYRMRPAYRAYVFDCLEVGDSKDIKDIAGYIQSGDLTVEHIMPQTLNQRWRDELGADAKAIHEKWVNRIANLTITGYNSEYSNQPFEKKKNMAGGFAESPYHVNSYVKTQDSWGLQQLEERAELLVAQALDTWRLPEVVFEPPVTVLPSFSLGSGMNFTGKAIAAVEIEGTKTSVRTWGDTVVIVMRELLALDRDGVLGMLETGEVFLVSKEGMDQAGFKSDENVAGSRGNSPDFAYKNGIVRLDPALGVRVNTSTYQKVALIRRVCEAIDYDTDEILFYLRGYKGAEADVRGSHGREVSSEAEGVNGEVVGPYADLTALIPLVDEVVGSSLAENETEELRKEFQQRFEQHKVVEPQQALGGKSLEAFLAEKGDDELSADEALACLSMISFLTSMMGQSVLHNAMLNGQVVRLLRALTTRADSNPIMERRR